MQTTGLLEAARIPAEEAQGEHVVVKPHRIDAPDQISHEPLQAAGVQIKHDVEHADARDRGPVPGLHYSRTTSQRVDVPERAGH